MLLEITEQLNILEALWKLSISVLGLIDPPFPPFLSCELPYSVSPASTQPLSKG